MKLFVWDFHGVLEKGNDEVVLEITNLALSNHASHRFGVNTHCQKKITKQDCLFQFLQGKTQFETIISIGDSPGDMTLIDHSIHIKGIGYLYSHPGKEHRQTKCHYKINDLRLVMQEITCETTAIPARS